MLLTLFLVPVHLPAQTPVTTWHYDNGRTSANTSETTLTNSNVNSSSFGKRFTDPVDGIIVGHPLYLPNVNIPGQGLHNVVYVCTCTIASALASSQNPSSLGQSVILTASVTPQYSGRLKAYVIFYDGTTALKTEYLSGGVAKYTTSTLTSGSQSTTATYNGNVDFNVSSASLTHKVN